MRAAVHVLDTWPAPERIRRIAKRAQLRLISLHLQLDQQHAPAIEEIERDLIAILEQCRRMDGGGR